MPTRRNPTSLDEERALTCMCSCRSRSSLLRCNIASYRPSLPLRNYFLGPIGSPYLQAHRRLVIRTLGGNFDEHATLLCPHALTPLLPFQWRSKEAKCNFHKDRRSPLLVRPRGPCFKRTNNSHDGSANAGTLISSMLTIGR